MKEVINSSVGSISWVSTAWGRSCWMSAARSGLSPSWDRILCCSSAASWTPALSSCPSPSSTCPRGLSAWSTTTASFFCTGSHSAWMGRSYPSTCLSSFLRSLCCTLKEVVDCWFLSKPFFCFLKLGHYYHELVELYLARAVYVNSCIVQCLHLMSSSISYLPWDRPSAIKGSSSS